MVAHECVRGDLMRCYKKALQEHTLQQDSSVLLTSDGNLHPFTSKLQQQSTNNIKAPLIISLGNGKPNWLNVGNAENSHLIDGVDTAAGSSEYNTYHN